MKAIRLKWKISAPPETVWDVLTKVKYIREWTGAPAKMSLKAGGRFSIWGDDIHGVNLAVEAPERLLQSWKEKQWDEDSQVEILLTQSGKGTQVSLVHTGVPESEWENIREGWDIYYFSPLKELAESLAQ